MNPQPSYNFGDREDGFTYREKHTHRHDVLERVIWVAGSFLVTLLAFRFIFSLLGANPENGFASFIYGFTAPFVSPFYDLFNYDHPTLGTSTFEGYTLIAMAVYMLGAAGLARLATITRY
jgi:YggT family protein